MAMTPEDMTSSADVEGSALLRDAALDLRHQVNHRWVEIADDVVSRALTASRPSWPVRAEASTGTVEVAEQVLVTYLRDSIDPIDDCEVVQIQVKTDGDVCTGVVIAVAVRFGTPLIPLADTVRQQAESRLGQLLGPVIPPITVTQMHVHVADVTRGDPKL